MTKRAAATLTLAAAVALGSGPVRADQATKTAAPPETTLRAPDAVVDDRIDLSRVTEQDIPPLPQQVLMPLPPDHRVADRAGQVPIDAARWDAVCAAISRGLAYLASRQDPSGGWMVAASTKPTDATGAAPEPASPVSVAVTALAVKSFAQFPAPAGDTARAERLERALAFIATARSEDGSYRGGALTNYVTSTVVSALAGVDEFAFSDEIRAAVTWLKGSQWDQSEGLAPRQDWFGGAGYGNHGRPDLSNTQMMLEAMYDAGLSPDEPAFQRALAFVSRTQNLATTNPAAWAGNDGGFVYTPANGGESMASEHAGEGRRGELRHGEPLPAGAPRSLRSYGSMTYAGFKSLLYAGLSPDDVRVRAAYDWVRRHWTMDENPGVGLQGLFYYYHAMSRALRVAQQHEVVDVEEQPHNWRAELIDALLARQREDGSWRNEADRWLEGEPVMATVYALLSLEEAIKPVSGMGGMNGMDGIEQPAQPRR